MESLIDGFYKLKKDKDGRFDEYSGQLWTVRATSMFGLGFLMLTIHLRKEFYALRYISVLILVAIVAAIIVNLSDFLPLGSCHPSPKLLSLLLDDVAIRCETLASCS